MAKGVDIKELQLMIKVNKASVKRSVNEINSSVKTGLGQVSETIKRGTQGAENTLKSSIGNIKTLFNSIRGTLSVVSGGFNELGRGSEEAGRKTTQSVSSMQKTLSSLENQLSRNQSKISEIQGYLRNLYAEQDKIIAKYSNMPAASGLTSDETLERLLRADSAYGRLSEQIEKLEVNLTPLKEKSNETKNKINELRAAIKGAGSNMEKMGKGAVGAGRNIRKIGDEAEKTGKKARSAGRGFFGFGTMISKSFGTIMRRLFVYNLMMKGIRGIMKYMGDALKTNAQFANSLAVVKHNIKTAFQPIYDFVLPALNALMNFIATATTYVASFISVIFGKTYKESSKAVQQLDKAKKGIDSYGKTAAKTAKQLSALGGFDELVSLDSKKEDSGASGGGGLASIPTPEVDTEAAEGSINRFIQRAKDSLRDMLGSLGINNIFSGIQEGLDLINFDGIKKNLRAVFEGWGEIGATAFEGLKTMAQPAGAAIGTLMKYGLASNGNIFESITIGFSNFTTNNKEKIQEWLNETSTTMANGFTNLDGIFENLGSIWLGSLEKYKEEIAGIIEDLLTNIANSVALRGTIWADTFEIVTGRIKQFTEENNGEIQAFTDSLVEMYTDAMEFLNTVWADTTTSIGKSWDEWGDGIVNTFMDVVGDIGGWLLYLWNDLVKPIWDTLMGYMSDLWENNLSGLVDGLLEFLGKVSEFLSALWNLVSPFFEVRLKVLVEGVKIIVGILLGYGKEIIAGVADTIGGILKALGGVMDFLTGVFTGDWRKAWEGIKNIFGGVMDAIGAMFKLPINTIIGGINGFIRGINKIQVPDWVPIVGGKGFNVPEIPKLADGGIVTRATQFIAGEAGAEVVFPLQNSKFIEDFARILAAMLGSNMEAAGAGGNTFNIGTLIQDDRSYSWLADVMAEYMARAGYLSN